MKKKQLSIPSIEILDLKSQITLAVSTGSEPGDNHVGYGAAGFYDEGEIDGSGKII